MSAKPMDVVRKGLQAYADRGVFRGLTEGKVRGKELFKFAWLGYRQLEFGVDTDRAILTFKNLLPEVSPSSELYSDLKRFLKSRRGSSFPEHRRIDDRRAEVLCVNRGGNVSIGIRVRDSQYAYSLNRLVNLVHDIFVQLNDSHPDYMCENFDVPQE